MVEGMSEVASPADMGSSSGLPRIDTTAGPKQSPAKKHNRRTLLLLTKNKGIQTRADLRGEGGAGNNQLAELSVELPLSANIADMPLLSAYHAESIATGRQGTSYKSGLTSPNPDDHSETSSLHVPGSSLSTGSGHILAVVEHLSKLLSRLRAADIPTLNKRLRKQHLPGDVSHLSRSTLQTLSKEIGDLKSQNAYFKPLLDINSSVAIQRREWNALLKLLRDVFDELVDMQALINDVTLNPKLAKRLQRDAYREDDELGGADPSGAAGATATGGLGWIANPITRLFVTPAAVTPEDEQLPNAGLASRSDRTRLKPDMPPGRAAPKQAAVASATTTHVEVGFGGVGMPTRGRVVPASSSSSVPQVDAAELEVPDTNGQMQPRTVSAAVGRTMKDSSAGSSSLMPPQPTLRRAKSRANRNELLGIFAGAQASSHSGTTDAARPGRQGLRTQSSQYFDTADTASGGASTGTVRQSDRTIRARPTRMSQGVEAVLDPHVSNRPGMNAATSAAAGGRAGRDGLADAYGDSAVLEEEEPSFQPLLYRTLRPRGNSDSSIRSTFISQELTDDALPARDLGVAGVGTGALTARQGGYGYGGILAGLRGKLWSTAPVSKETAALTSGAGPDADLTTAKDAASLAVDMSAGTSTLGAPAMARSVSTGSSPGAASTGATKAVPIARSVSSTGSTAPASVASPRSHSQSPSQSKNGILGYIASSLGGEALLDPESDAHGQFGGGRSPGRMGRAEEEDMMRAALRQGSGVARRHQRWE